MLDKLRLLSIIFGFLLFSYGNIGLLSNTICYITYKHSAEEVVNKLTGRVPKYNFGLYLGAWILGLSLIFLAY